MPAMGRRRTLHHDLPPGMARKGERYYYGRNQVALGPDFRDALLKYADLHSSAQSAATFADAVRGYLRDELSARAPKTQDEYSRQAATLVRVFGAMELAAIRPKHINDWKRARAEHPIAWTREKALFSVIFNYARANGLTDAANPCAGIKGKKSVRRRYVTDAELSDAVARAIARNDPTLAAFLELCYYTGQRPGDVSRMRRSDVSNGVLSVVQAKTGENVRIAIEGALATLVGAAVGSVWLVRDARGQRLTLQALRRRFDHLDCDWQLRDLRRKAGTDSESHKEAQRLLGHKAATTTDTYINRGGDIAKPPRDYGRK